ncbi:MAG TPA: hypothetical protein GXX75_16420 [Clostridiales bacterium]|nr:hypothetical protein [Clostridiales bacterium]
MNLSKEVFETAPTYRRNPWKPKKGLILSGSGQNSIESVLAASLALGDERKPALVAFYEGVSDGEYIKNWMIREVPALFPGAVLQIGFGLPNQSEEKMQAVARGEWNDVLKEAAIFYRDLGLTILLRIGFEFDSTIWNHYKPETYIGAYRQFVNVIEAVGAKNVATVWDAYSIGTDITPDFYPGDDCVDWFGFNSLAPNFFRENHMAQMAHAHDKPIMSGEAAYALGVEDMSFHDWIHGYFDSFRRDGVQAAQYINWEWEKSRRAKGWNHWVNSRFTEDAERTKDYIEAMHGDDMVYRDANYLQPVCVYVDPTMNCYEGKAPDAWSKDADRYCLVDGFDYHLEGVIPKFEEPIRAGWEIQDVGKLHFDTPGDFYGECIIWPSENEESFTFYVNDEEIFWNKRLGWLHIPVEGAGQVDLTLKRVDGKPLHIKGVALVKKDGSLEDPKPIRIGKGIKWDALPNALHYRVYRGHQLIGVTADTQYPLSEETGSSYSVDAVYRYHGASGRGLAI